MLRSAIPLAIVALTLVACEQPRAMGEANAIIIAASPERWEELRTVVEEGLEPTIQTVRDERPFRLSYQDPSILEHWGQLRRFRQVLAVGTADDPWVADAIAARRGSDGVSAPGLFQVQNVWARGQLVSVLLLPDGTPIDEVAALVEELRATLDQTFREYVDQRMFISGRDSVLADSLYQNAGFSFLFPSVYRYSVRDSVFRFRNDQPSPTERIREIVITWVEPAPEAFPTQEEMMEWRPTFTREFYNDPQDIEANVESYGPISVGGRDGVEYQSAWVSTPEGWPAGGPFISRAVRCPDQNRMYLMDAWLYAPGQAKYEYMIQLQTILNSFRCQ